MNLNDILLRALALIGALHLLSQVFLWNHFPGHTQPSSLQSDPISSLKDRILETKNEESEDEIHGKEIQPPQKGHAKIDYPKKRRFGRKKPKWLPMLQNERNLGKPTAHTTSPYLKHPLFVGKERLLTMLHEAHYFNDSAPEFFQDEAKVEALSSKLPLWETITDRLGGGNPAVEGLDTCAKFQSLVPPEERFIGVAGLFATGTNLLASLLVANCKNKERLKKYDGAGVRWQVNWGKHSPARYRLQNKIDPRMKNENYLPVVTIRHPYSWMQSMCRQRYSTHWFHNAKEHCPNLIPNEIDRRWYKYVARFGKRGVNKLYKDPWLRDNLLDLANYTLDSRVVPVRVRYKSGTLFHESLAHMWNEWYHEYVDGDFPRIIVRLEDLAFHAKEVVTKVCTCIGGQVEENFQYITETAKVGDENIHGKQTDRTNMIKWFTKWHLEDRTKNMTQEDRDYAKQSLDPDLLKMFQYQHP